MNCRYCTEKTNDQTRQEGGIEVQRGTEINVLNLKNPILERNHFPDEWNRYIDWLDANSVTYSGMHTIKAVMMKRKAAHRDYSSADSWLSLLRQWSDRYAKETGNPKLSFMELAQLAMYFEKRMLDEIEKGDESEFFKLQNQSSPAPSQLAMQNVQTSQMVRNVVLSKLKGQLNEKPRILEPTAGDSALAKWLVSDYPKAKLDAIDADKNRQNELRQMGYNPAGEDFLSFIPHKAYDAVVMNTAGNPQTYAAQVVHGFDILAPSGTLVAIVPENIQDLTKSISAGKMNAGDTERLRKFIYQYGKLERLITGENESHYILVLTKPKCHRGRRKKGEVREITLVAKGTGKRGRPRIRPLPDENQPKRKRGRPRIHPLPDENQPKRKRGRPPGSKNKKVAAFEA
mgnify:FL=1